jgi:hypothetical protein
MGWILGSTPIKAPVGIFLSDFCNLYAMDPIPVVTFDANGGTGVRNRKL